MMTDEWTKNRALQPDHGGVEPDEKDHDAKRREQDAKRRKTFDDALERGLEDSFPGSDPVAVTQPPSSPYDKHKA
jgi:hypothetical protein